MTGRAIGGVRRAQLITTYGVGALVALENESYMVAGIDHWPAPARETLIHEPRLQRRLKVQEFHLPPTSDNDMSGDVPVVRFPVWHVCPESGRLAEYRKWGAPRGKAVCKEHDRALVPSRFVMCCARGHIDDFPYFNWVHKGSAPTGADDHEMTLISARRSAALRDIVVSCSCGKEVSMDGALGKNSLKDVIRCTGRRPWLGESADHVCDQIPRAMQRGASGVWFSNVRSAISIPPWSEGIQKLISRSWRSLSKTRDRLALIEDLGLADGTPFTATDILAEVDRRLRVEAGLDDETGADIKPDEYEALCRETPEEPGDQDFVCVAGDRGQGADALGIDLTMRVKRLREVRVLESFSRLYTSSPSADVSRRASLYREDAKPNWLPAIEVIGEGVFLTLDQRRLAEWESSADVLSRVAPMATSYEARFSAWGGRPDRVITPRLVLVHTLAHAIINEWSLDAGYPAASLRERLYVSDTMAGLLIYTATSDSAGSLGGIVAQVESNGLAASIWSALERSSWCSADPLCIETQTTGVDNLNRAACHACVLLPETSCEEFNTLLDRGLLIGEPGKPDIGFFGIG